MASECSYTAAENYDMPLHILAVFLIFIFSLLGAILPLLAYWCPRLKVNELVLLAGNFFGIGVVISTAFVHMIPSAFLLLNSPCLGSLGSTFPPFPMVVVMVSVLAMQLMEFFLTRCMMASAQKSWKKAAAVNDDPASVIISSSSSTNKQMPTIDYESALVLDAELDLNATVPATTTVIERESIDSAAATTLLFEPKRVHFNDNAAGDITTAATTTSTSGHGSGGCAHHNMDHLKDFDEEKSRGFIGLVIFELGIACHSVFVGIALGVISGQQFKTLLTALVFHQFFEGFALGSSVASINPSRLTAVSTVVGYVLSTPLGVALGIIIRSSYNQNSATALWTQGIFNAVSGGTLVYAGVVELLTYGMTLNEKFSPKEASTTTLTVAYTSLYVGAAAMSVVGKWA